MRWIPLLLITAACADNPEGNLVTSSIPADGVRRIVVTATSGSLHVSTGGTDAITMTSPKGARFRASNGTVQVTHVGGGTLHLVAPMAVDLVASTGKGGIEVFGRWGDLDLDTHDGPITIAVKHARACAADALKGDVTFECDLPPTGNVTLTAVTGNVVGRMAEGYRGLVQISAPEGKMTFPQHIRSRRTPTSAMAFVGAAFTPKELAEVPADKRAGFWLTAKRGDVTFVLK